MKENWLTLEFTDGVAVIVILCLINMGIDIVKLFFK